MFDLRKVNNREAFFLYSNVDGKKSTHAVVNLVDKDDYIQGYSVTSRGYRTFRKDRVMKMFSDQVELDHFTLNEMPVETTDSLPLKVPRSRLSSNNGLEICFTGFNKDEKDELTNIAQSRNLAVRAGVTAKLSFLCCGPNAGWRKIESANAKGALILSASQFRDFIETGEIPYESPEIDEKAAKADEKHESDIEKLQSVMNNAASTFSTIRSFQRSNVLIAQFEDGYAVGWKFAVKSVFREALDIKLTTSVFDGHKYETWTQGNKYAFHRGDAFYSDKLGYSDWSEFLNLEHAVILKVKFECYAGYETIATLDGKFSGTFVPDNVILKTESLTDLPILIESQSYDAGTLTIDVLRPNADRTKVEVKETISLNQDEFISLLQTGYYWKKEKGSAPVKVDILKNDSP
ncbi:hypothetical protein ACTVL4_13415 [Serratia nevei]|uniref:hypothetical protein n=1 Tax=Serratia nevei TaxID=2703794 RepID=UPI003FA7A683